METAFENLTLSREYLNEIPVLSTIDYCDFFNEYLSKNQACIVKNVTKEWPATKDWVVNNKINFDYLYKKYKHSDVLIYNCNDKYYNSHKTSDMEFLQYLVYLEAYIKSKYSNQFPLLYLLWLSAFHDINIWAAVNVLKDWHVINQNQKDEIYKVPKYFQSDWLNEYLVEKGLNDYRFVYIGPKGSWTPFHEDVFTSYSWSANVTGKKLWWLFPPGEEEKLKNSQNNLPFDVEDEKHKARHFEVIQEPGDAIFVPSGWFHQVFNLEDTISINHNWVNGCNIKTMWLKLEHQYNLVLKELDDCKDMEDFHERSEVIFKEVAGVNFNFFFDFIQFIANKRLEMVGDTRNEDYQQSLFDLKCICNVLEILLCSNQTVFYNFDDCNSLLKIIKHVLNIT